MEQELLAVGFAIDKLAHDVDSDHETTDRQEQECVVEFFVDHIELFIRGHPGEE